jgi:hypothetical protein
MRIPNILCFVAMTFVPLAAVTTSASAQSDRDTIVQRCLQRAQAQFPGTDATVDRNRTSVYKACMTEAGLTP